jgi:hypothetical protein
MGGGTKHLLVREMPAALEELREEARLIARDDPPSLYLASTPKTLNGFLGRRGWRQIFMRSIAKRWRLCMLTLAPPDLLALRHLVFHRLNTGAFMRAIAKRRMARATTSTPPMHTRINFKTQRFRITNNRLFWHAAKMRNRLDQCERETTPNSFFASSVGSALSLILTCTVCVVNLPKRG